MLEATRIDDTGGHRIPLLAHSPQAPDEAGDPYERHVRAVCQGARERARCMLRYAAKVEPGLLDAIETAARFHDLGKLDPDIQQSMRTGRGSKLPWDHIDAGVAYLSQSSIQNWMAAWLVRAHHAPGLPEKQEHFNPDGIGRRLRGRRRDEAHEDDHKRQINRTDAKLTEYLKAHESLVEPSHPRRMRPIHGLTMRLALSCLVDADHSDTASVDSGRSPEAPPATRWGERLGALSLYVHSLQQGETESERERNRQRTDFFEACLNSDVNDPMVACEAPVGTGKTTSIAAYLIRRARDEGLRRLIFVAPFTNILTQTAERLRNALVLPGERPGQVIVEHHHRADFESLSERELAVLWQAPIVLTTAVSFFETLAACSPSSLRKLHSLPGSAIFLDEAHAALPTKLWPQNWNWLCELAQQWGCRIVFASGSLARFWEENCDIVASPTKLPELVKGEIQSEMLRKETARLKYKSIADGSVIDIAKLIRCVQKSPGPRLVILSTVQNAAVVALAMRRQRIKALHLSTALCPRDREQILRRVTARLAIGLKDWTLVATSCIEAGVDLSFRVAFRERFAVASIIQVGGRVNRHGEQNSIGGGVVYDFALSDHGITQHPAAAESSPILRELLTKDVLNDSSPSNLITEAMREELKRYGGLGADLLTKAEESRNYPEVAERGRVIESDTRLVVVCQDIEMKLKAHEKVSSHELLRASVQLWATKIAQYNLRVPLPGRREVYVWNARYDPKFLGIMAGVLQTQEFLNDPNAQVV